MTLVAADGLGDRTGNDRIEALMNRHLMTLAPLDSPQEAAYRLLRSQLAALPVVGAEGELLVVPGFHRRHAYGARLVRRALELDSE